jgi:hypothetical protein
LFFSAQDPGRVQGDGRPQLGAGRAAERKELPEKP